MDVHTSELLCASQNCEASTVKSGNSFFECHQKRDSRDFSKVPVMDYHENNDNFSDQKKVNTNHQADQVNFAIPATRKGLQQNQSSIYQLQASYQQLPPLNPHNEHFGYPVESNQWTQSSLFNPNSFHHQGAVPCLDRLSAVKSNKFPDTPPDSGSEPYSPPTNASMNFVDLSSLPATNEYSNQAYNIRSFHSNLGSSYPHYLRPPRYVTQSHPRHFSCSFPRPPFGMYGTMEFSNIGPRTDFKAGEERHIYNSLQNASHQPMKKRKLQDSPHGSIDQLAHGISIPIKHEPYPPDFQYASLQADGGSEDEFNFEYACDGSIFQDGSYRVFTWSPYQQHKWASLVDEGGRDVTLVNFRVDADKGFNFALPDESFVCQKKNHFQITVHVKVSLKPKFVRTPESSDVLESIDSLYLHFYGIKAESPNQTIKIEQSQSDRSKKVFNPVQIDLVPEEMNKVTVGRLHFSETTLNNMRKKGKPNPDQRYFQLVVALEAHCSSNVFIIAAHFSDKIIVRASNPGQFENDADVVWSKGKGSDVIYHTGRVGINTENPDEALTVHGNIRITGHVMTPSDIRAKINIEELDTCKQLRNISRLNVYKYRFNEEFADYAGLSDEEKIGAGVLAQEVYRILPDAVRETGDVILKNGHIIKNLLLVNKERIFMENVGAVKELCKVTDKLEGRINEMESVKQKLASYCKSKLGSWSLSSQLSLSAVSGSLSSIKKPNGSSLASKSYNDKQQLNLNRRDDFQSGVMSPPSLPRTSFSPFCNFRSTHTMHLVIISLIIIMATCLISITTLYIIDRQSSNQQNQQLMMSLKRMSNRSNTFLSYDNTKRKNLIPPICLAKQNECPIVCCEMPPNNPSGDFIGQDLSTSTVRPRPWWAEYMPSSKSWKKAHQKFRDVPFVYAKPGKGLSNKTKPKKVEFIPPKFVQRHENKHSRLKRDVQRPMIRIYIPQMNYTLGQEFCTSQDCKDMRGSNFSFSIPLSNRYPLAFTTIQFMPLANDESLNVEFCSEAKHDICEEHRDESIFDSKRVGLFSWDLPIGFFFNSQFNFRVTSSEVDDPCTLPGLARGVTFAAYNLQFYRSCDK